MAIEYLNGKRLYYGFISGANEIIRHQDILNRINVFPVADSDTGTNLASTMKAVINNARFSKSFNMTVDAIANAALEGSRGNSGIIFSQFLYGLSKEITHKSKIDADDFVYAVKKAVKYPYNSLSNPVEGTIITVMKAWAESIEQTKDVTVDFKTLLSESLKTARQELKDTTKQLEVLKELDIVDAGAMGFVFFIEGIVEFMKTGTLKSVKREVFGVREEISVSVEEGMDFKYRYCTEALIEGQNIEREQILKKLKVFGGSAIVAGDDQKVKMHVHTDDPAHVISSLRPFGRIFNQKVDDMRLQYRLINEKRSKIALVTDSACDLPQEVLDYYNISLVPITLSFGEDSYLDKVTMTPDLFYTMLDSEEEHPKTSQPSEGTFTALFSFLTKHYDSIIAIHLSSKLSGTWNISKIAAEKMPEKKIDVIDSKHLSGSLGLLVLRAAEAINSGRSHEEVVEAMDVWASKAKIYVGVNTLKFMVRGGRVSPMQGWIGNLINLKPIVSLDEQGKGITFGKSFSQMGSIKKIMQALEESAKKGDLKEYVVLHAHSKEFAEKCARLFEKVLYKKPTYIMDISPVIGLSAGIGAVAVALMET